MLGRVKLMGKKPQRIREVSLPIRPFVAAGKFLVGVRHIGRTQRLVQLAIGGEQRILRATIKADRGQCDPLSQDRLRHRMVLRQSRETAGTLLDELAHLSKLGDRRMARDRTETAGIFHPYPQRAKPSHRQTREEKWRTLRDRRNRLRHRGGHLESDPSLEILQPMWQVAAAVPHNPSEGMASTQGGNCPADCIRAAVWCAQVAAMTPAAFSRYFKRETRRNVSDLLNDLRVDHAARLLRETTQSVSDIALESGFATFSNFNRRFRERRKCSPREYRRALALLP